MIALFHEQSSGVDILKRTRAGEVVTFTTGESAEAIAAKLLPVWTALLQRLPYEPPTVWSEFEPYLAHRVAERQCRLFDRVVKAHPVCRSGEEARPEEVSLGALGN
jgi:hypothetical protein